MSRFSKKEAEKAGWVFVHSSSERFEFNEDDPQGRSLRIAPSVRAEKRQPVAGQSDKLINEEAETIGLLLERIYAYEQQHAAKAYEVRESEFDLADTHKSIVLDEDRGGFRNTGERVASVLLPDGSKVTEAEWATRDKGDVIVTDEGTVFLHPTEPAVFGEELRQEVKREAEDESKSAFDVGPTTQIVVDNHDSIDSPGQGAPSLIVVREGEEDIASVSLRKDADEAEIEDARVQAARAAAEARKADEEASVSPMGEKDPQKSDKK